MTTYREADVTARFEQVDARLAVVDKRLQELDHAHARCSANDNAKKMGSLIPDWVRLTIIAGAIVGSGFLVLVGAREMVQYDERVESRQRADCQTLCGSMGLNGGVVMPWSGWWYVPGTTERRTISGQSCVCGDGNGSSVRVDPDGSQGTRP